ncbi:rhodanese-like domain-containing protein [Chitinophaga lutea]
MNRILSTICLLLATCAGMAQSVSPDEFEKGMGGKGVQLLDVRTAKEFGTGHFDNALQADFTKKDEFFERIQYVDKSKPVYVYCLSGGRSGAAAKWMRENGYSNVVEMDGGIMAWKKAGKAVPGATRQPQMKQEDFEKNVAAAKWVLVDVGAAWCPPCRKMAPVVQQFTTEKKVKLLNVDGGNDTEVMANIKADVLPTFVLYKNGKEVWRKQGIVTMEEFTAAMK